MVDYFHEFEEYINFLKKKILRNTINQVYTTNLIKLALLLNNTEINNPQFRKWLLVFHNACKKSKLNSIPNRHLKNFELKLIKISKKILSDMSPTDICKINRSSIFKNEKISNGKIRKLIYNKKVTRYIPIELKRLIGDVSFYIGESVNENEIDMLSIRIPDENINVKRKRFSKQIKESLIKYFNDFNNLTVLDDTFDEEVDADFNQLRQDLDRHLLPKSGHKVLILQPNRNHGKLYLKPGEQIQSIFEAKALINTLRWEVIGEEIANTRTIMAKTFFTSGNYEKLIEKLRHRKDITAIFVNYKSLSSLQILSMERDWQKVIYDRYMMVLQIFKLHAQTADAKLQVQLAELPYFRSRLYGYHLKSHSNIVMKELENSTSHLGMMNSSLEEKYFILKTRQHKLNLKIKELESKRDLLRNNRKSSKFPIISVLGYTNAGKTSLIKSLTHDEKVTPKDCLFATLDVTYHEFYMKFNANNNFGMKVLLIDTIGFLSDIPTTLIAAFRSTLRDTVETDLLIHVVDLSNDFWKAQMDFTLETLKSYKLPEKLMKSIITVGTKIDCISSSTLEALKINIPNLIPISNITGENIDLLHSTVSKVLQENVEFVYKRIKVTHGSQIYQWISSNAFIQNLQVSEDSQKLLIDVMFLSSSWEQFQNIFHKK